MVELQVSQVHVSLGFSFVASEMHVSIFIFFLVVCLNCLNVDGVLRTEFIWSIFRWLILVRLASILLSWPS